MPNQEPIELPAVVEKQHIIAPLVSPDEAVQMLDQYEALKTKIVRPDDVQKIQGKDFLKKSYWRRLAKFFGLSISIQKEWKEEDAEVVTYYVVARATAPSGQSSDGDGACSTDEKGLEKTPHNARAIAVTRAKNRAISDLVGGGEVSAEEINGQQPTTPQKNQFITQPQRRRLYAIAKDAGYTNEEIKTHLEVEYGATGTADVKRENYEQICEDFEKGRAVKGKK